MRLALAWLFSLNVVAVCLFTICLKIILKVCQQLKVYSRVNTGCLTALGSA